MPTDAEISAQVETALRAAPKPVDSDAALAIAADILRPYPRQAAQFIEWFNQNGVALLGRINGN